MRFQVTLTSQQCKRLLGKAFWGLDLVERAKRIVFCKSTTSALILSERFEDFDPSKFVAGLIQKKGLCLSPEFPKEVLVEDGRWSHQKLLDLRERLEPTDIVVKSGNIYDGERVGVLIMSETSYGTLGVIYPNLYDPPKGMPTKASVFSPMLLEKRVPAEYLTILPRPDKSYGWPARLAVFEPDTVFDERDAFRELLGAETSIIGKGASIEGLATITFQLEVPEKNSEVTNELLRNLLESSEVSFTPRNCSPLCPSCEWAWTGREA